MKKKGLFISKLSAYKWRIITASVLGLIGSTAQMLVPNQIKKISEYLEEHMGGEIEIQSVLPIIIITVGLIAAYCILTLFGNMLVTKVTGKIGYDVREALNKKIDRIPLSFMDKMSVGDLQSRMTNDVDTMTNAMLDVTIKIPANIISLILILILMFTTNVYMSLSLIAATLIGFMISAFVLGKCKPHTVLMQNSMGEVNSVISETLSGHLVVKAFGCEKDMIDNFEDKNEKMRKASKHTRFYSGIIYPIMTFAGNLGYIAVCITAAILFSTGGNITLGSLAAFILYAGIVAMPLSELINSLSVLQPATAAADRIEEMIDAEEMTDPDGSVHSTDIKGAVVFDHVKFGYTPEQVVLKDLSAVIRPGQKIAIVGPTGAGKSTFVNLLMRFYEPQEGTISLDGIPISQMDRDYLHSLIGMVLQDTWTFNGSIRDNIVYSTPGVTEEKLEEIVNECGLKFYLDTLPDGLDTVIGEQSEISAGQRQLITIARAMAKDAPVLILDEATSSIDTRTELLIQKALDALVKGRTSFVIAHRLSTIRNADCIFVMKDGDVIEMGSHDELIAKNGFYKELYYSQFDN